jgi:hypothetical protein
MARKASTAFRLISVEDALKLPKIPLYKMLLRSAQKFPSIKRQSFIEEIKTRMPSFHSVLTLIILLEFRQNRSLSDPEKIRRQVEISKSRLIAIATTTHF